MLRNLHIKTLLTALLVAVAAMVPQSCRISYKLNGAAIDYTVYRTIHIGEFPIRAALVYAPLQQTFENELMDYVTRNTRLQVVDGASDLELEGEITGYNLSPQAVTEDAYASKTRLTITVRDANSIDQSFSAYRDFDASQMLTDVQEQLCSKISKELIDLIFNATLGNW